MKKTLFDSIPLSIGEVTDLIKGMLEKNFANVYVVGEISELSSPSGHRYLRLKDSRAILPAVIWCSTMARVKFDLRNGMEVLCRGSIAVYPPHGRYQLIVNSIEPQGIGALELAFRQLHDKLKAEGLFLGSRKKPIPATPRRVAVITSATGAAVRDFINTLARRTRRIETVVVPVKVQGESASSEIRAAFEMVNRRWTVDPPDCIVLIRGGGSPEDLWCFNEEATVRAVADSRIPVVTGIGHEIDTSLSDLAADLHALTPTDAAIRLVAVEDAMIERKLEELRFRLDRNLDRYVNHADDILRRYANCPLFQDPVLRLVEPRRASLERFDLAAFRAIRLRIERGEGRIAELAAKIEALSPLAVLGRGYSLTQKTNGQIVRDADDVEPGETVVTRLTRGSFESTVTQKDNNA